jgi:hypothetical protein
MVYREGSYGLVILIAIWRNGIKLIIPAQAGIQQSNIPRSGQCSHVVPLRGVIFNQLDSRLRGKDRVFC